MKKFLIGVFGLLLIAVLVVAVVGMMLPVSHVASVRAEYSAGAADLYDAISDYRGHPDWRPSVDRIEELPPRDGKPAWQEVGSTGTLPMEMTESDPPHRMVTTILSEGMPFGGRWIYAVESLGDKTTLTITEEGEVYNPIFRFVSRFVMGHHRTATTYLQDLGGKLADEVIVEVVR